MIGIVSKLKINGLEYRYYISYMLGGIRIDSLFALINSIPQLMQYFVSGYVFLVIFTNLTSVKAEEKIRFILSCIISYINVTLISVTNELFIHNRYLEEPLIVSGLAIILSTITSITWAKLYSSRFFHDFMIRHFNKSQNEDIWRDIIDFDNGSLLKVYVKGYPYYIVGKYKSHEEKGDKSWFVLSGFSKLDRETNLNYKNEPDFSLRVDVLITIRLCEVEHIEIF